MILSWTSCRRFRSSTEFCSVKSACLTADSRRSHRGKEAWDVEGWGWRWFIIMPMADTGRFLFLLLFNKVQPNQYMLVRVYRELLDKIVCFLKIISLLRMFKMYNCPLLQSRLKSTLLCFCSFDYFKSNPKEAFHFVWHVKLLEWSCYRVFT